MSIREPHGRTIATLDKLEAVTWFEKVGVKEFVNVLHVGSWQEAMRAAASPNWEDLTLEMANQLREKILKVDKKRFEEWNEAVTTIKKFSNALVFDKTFAVLAEFSLGNPFLHSVQWDILHLCMEAEFGDIVEPGFYHAIAFYYLKGHFPCGVSGDAPDLIQVVF